MNAPFPKYVLLLSLIAGLWACGKPADAQTPLRNICRVKGQEENTLQGLGIVVGLKGTGDGDFTPAIRNLAKALTVMKEPLGDQGFAELRNAKNVAIVVVTATIPRQGARQGDQLDCVISSIGSAKTLAGGRLFLAPMVGPNKNESRIYGFAQGLVTLDDPAIPTTGRIHGGCRLEEDFFNPYFRETENGPIVTFVLHGNHASFEVAQSVVDAISQHPVFGRGGGGASVRAVNQGNIEVMIPALYRTDPVKFIAQILDAPILNVRPGARVVIHERAGSIVISGDAEIAPVVVTHKNGITVQAGAAAAPESFVAIDPNETSTAKLKSLVAALNAVRVPPADIIDIIKGLHRNGSLHAELIIE